MYKVVSSQRILSKHNELQLTLSQPAVGLAYETATLEKGFSPLRRNVITSKYDKKDKKIYHKKNI